MELSFRCLACLLALTSTLLVVSANSHSGSATATASATIVTPADVTNKAKLFYVSTFGGSDMGDLVIHLPGAAPPGIISNYPQLIAATRLAIQNRICVHFAGSLHDCVKHKIESGVLEGDPVSSVMLTGPEHVYPGRDTISLTVVYN